MTRLLRAVICHAGVLLCMLGYADLVYDSAAQVFSRDTPSEATRALPSKRLGKLIPYEGYEERLRQPARWQTMTPDEQAEAIGKIVLARKQFLERQQKLQAKYENKIKKSRKLKEIIAGKWRTQKHHKERDTLWSRFQQLPIKKRHNLEGQLGLRNIRSSQLQEKFQESIDGLSYSKRNHILRQLQ